MQAGVTTPGAVSPTFVAAYIPKGQEQYVALTTATATGPVLGTITRPTFEEAAATAPKPTAVAGQYQYTFKAQAPAGFDPTTTYTVAVVGSRDLTEFNLGTNYAGTTFNFVPNGAAVTVTRDVIRTQSCNRCHDQLAFHGGHAFGMDMCVLCHQPQNADPTSGNTLDLKVMAHKIHMGSQLPSVIGYTAGTQTVPATPYQIYGYMNSISDFSTVVDPANPAALRGLPRPDHRRGASQSFHDRADPGGLRRLPRRRQFRHRRQPSRRHSSIGRHQCANCHVPQGETPFDASILGAHVVANDTAATIPAEPGYADRRHPGNHHRRNQYLRRAERPRWPSPCKDNKGNPLALSQTSRISIHHGRSYHRLRLHQLSAATSPALRVT